MQFKSFVKIGGVFVATMVLLAAGAIMAAKFVNLDQVKEILTTQVKKNTGRTLTIAGPLELQVGLVPSLVAQGVTLSNPVGSTHPEMMKIDRFEMGIALMPLLKREIVVNRLILSSPDILIETEPKGPGNLDFSLPTEKIEPPASGPTPSAAKGEEAAYLFTVKDLKITNGRMVWYDRATKKSQSVGIQELTLQPDRAASGLLATHLLARINDHKIDISGTVGGSDTVLGGTPWPLNLKAQIDGINLNAEGNVADLAAFSGVKVNVAAQGAELMQAIRLVGMTKPDLPQRFGPFKVAATLSDAGQQLNLSDVVVEAGNRDLLLLNAKGTVKDLAGTAAVDMVMSLESGNPSAAAKLAGFEFAGKGPVKLTGQVRGSDKTWKMNDLNLIAHIDGVNLNVEGNIADLAAFSGIKVKVAAQGDELIQAVRLAGMTQSALPQRLGPFKVSATLSDAGKQLNLADAVVEAGNRDLLLFNAKGAVKDLAGTATVDMIVNLESDNPSAAAQLAGAEFSGKGPVKIAGQLRGGDKTWTLTELKSFVGGSDVSGELTAHLAPRLRLSGKLKSASLNLADFTKPAASPHRRQPHLQKIRNRNLPRPGLAMIAFFQINLCLSPRCDPWMPIWPCRQESCIWMTGNLPMPLLCCS